MAEPTGCISLGNKQMEQTDGRAELYIYIFIAQIPNNQ